MCFEATASANIATTLIIVMAEALHIPVQQQLFHTIIKLIIIGVDSQQYFVSRT